MKDDQHKSEVDGVVNVAASILDRAQWWSLFTLLVASVFISGCYAMVNGDIWWHLKTGEMILETGQIPKRNLFTYTNPGSVWVDLHWLFQVIVASIYRGFGTGGLVFGKAVIGAMVFALIISTSYKRLPGAVMVCCWLPFIWIYSGRFHVRPEMLSHLFLAATLFCIHKHRTGAERWIWFLIPIQIAWVNSQGLFVLQICVLGAYCLNEQIRFLKKRQVAKVWYVLVSCFFATLLNPYGLEGSLFPLELLAKVGGDKREFFQLLAAETTGMGQFLAEYGVDGVVRSSTPRLLFLTAPVCLIAFFLSALQKKKMAVFHALVMLGFGYLAWNMNRNASLFAIVWGYVLCDSLGEVISARNDVAGRYAVGSGMIQRAIAGVLLLFLAVSLVVSVVDVFSNTQLKGNHRPVRFAGFGEDPWYNHEAAEFIRDLPDVENVYVHYNGTGFAGVVIYHAFGEEQVYPKRVFADARLEANSLPVLEDFLNVMGDGAQRLEHAEKILGKYSQGPPALVFKNSDMIYRPQLLQDLIASERWRSVYLSTKPNLFEGVVVFVPDRVVQQHGLEIVPVSVLRSLP